MTIATAAKQVIVDRMDIVVAGGVESISLVQTPELRVDQDPELLAMHGDFTMPMIETAEIVAARYGISRERCDEMGIGPVFAVPRLLERFGLKMDDIGLWELNEAFAVQVLYCQDQLRIPNDRLNVNGGAISIGHPYGMSGARMVGHALIEGNAAARAMWWSPCAWAAVWARRACSKSSDREPACVFLIFCRRASTCRSRQLKWARPKSAPAGRVVRAASFRSRPCGRRRDRQRAGAYS
jgi:acetyl-CoA acetyltransferase